jgi:hypothetical protein
MPYIDPAEQARLLPFIRSLSPEIRTGGELNFAITVLAGSHVLKMAGLEQPRYDDYKAVVGDMVCALLEFYRVKVAPYEDEKRKLNGDTPVL